MASTRFRSGDWWAGLLSDSFGPGFWGFFAVAVATGAACYVVLGAEAFAEAVQDDLEMVLQTLPRIVAALSIAGLLWVMLPRERLTKLIGSGPGPRGLLIATAVGVITPGGPASAFSLLALLGGAGVDRGVLVAYITSWAMLGFQRILVWDVPFMGAEFSLVRFFICLPLPILAGLIARRLPITLRLAEAEPVAEARR
jgi:uncharacterized membrane protein YraQ (UPF0718 family)